MKNKKVLALIAIIIIISAISIVTLYVIIKNAPDNIPPIVNINEPAEGETLSGTNSIIFTANDQQGVITEREILIDGVIIQSSSYSYTWDTTQEI